MTPYQDILAIADPQQQGSWALKRAAQLAQASGATLHLRSFCHHPGIAAVHAVSAGVAELAQRELMREQRDWLEREADSLRSQVSKVRVEVVWGTPVQEKIIAEILALRPDLVVKDVEHVPALKRLLFTPLDLHLLRTCPAPLLMVNREPRPLRTVVAAVDVGAGFPETTSLNADLLEAARNLASLGSTRVELLHVFEGLPGAVAATAEADLAAPDRIYAQLREDRAQAFTVFAERHRVPEDRRHLLDGLPDMALAAFVEDNVADVVVMGSMNRTGLDRVLIGSTAERMLGRLHCDVLVLKPRRFVEMLERHFGLERAA